MTEKSSPTRGTNDAVSTTTNHPVPTLPPSEPAPSLRPVEGLQALCDAATPAPWHRIYDRVVTEDYDEEADPDDFAAMQRRCTVAKTHPFEMRLSRDPRHIADAEFIAAARTALPSLLARLRAAEETLARATSLDTLFDALLEAQYGGMRPGGEEREAVAQLAEAVQPLLRAALAEGASR